MVERVSLLLARLIYDYIKNRKNIDETFIDKVVELVVNNLGLNDYVTGLEIDNNLRKSDSMAHYNWYTKKITIEFRASMDFIVSTSKTLKLNDNEKIAIIYDRIAGLILHELEHADQMKKMDSKDKSLETKIIKYSNRHISLIHNNLFDEFVKDGVSEHLLYFYLQRSKKCYDEYYKYAPVERLAEYYAHKTMATVFREIGTMPNISYYECLRLCANYLKGYKERIVPTKFYLDKIVTYYSWEELEKEGRNLDFEARASLGLPISDAEYDYLLDTTASLRELVLK